MNEAGARQESGVLAAALGGGGAARALAAVLPERPLAVLVDPTAGDAVALLRGLPARDRLAVMRDPAAAGELAAIRLESDFTVRDTNADLLVLDGTATAQLWSSRNFRGARAVLVPLGPVMTTARALLCYLKVAFHRRLKPLGILPPAQAGARRWLAFAVADRRLPGAREYLSPLIGFAGLFAELRERGIDYVVLRWFETLPDLPKAEDLDLLVADKDAETLRKLLRERVGTRPIDVYSVTGVENAGAGQSAYFPPVLAEAVLSRAVDGPAGSRVPAPKDALLSLAYHAAYQKGAKSGLPESAAAPESGGSKYRRGLARLASALAIELELSLDGLDRLLAAEGWRPPRDMLNRLAADNGWLERRYFAEQRSALPYRVGAVVLREAALAWGIVDQVVADFRAVGFEVLAQAEIPVTRRKLVAAQTRGGNWSQGPFPADGGLPAVFLLLLDPAPLEFSKAERKCYRTNDNARLLVKETIRERHNARRPERERANFIHSSDTTEEAWEYCELALPERVEALRRDVAERIAALAAGEKASAAA
ncbi:MAG: hypothetical protein ACREDZ_12930 [Kiloniellales bacterium]